MTTQTSHPTTNAPASSQPPATESPSRAPMFAKHFPEDEKLQDLLTAFMNGHYDIVRRDAEKLASTTNDPHVAKAARDLRRRIEPNPLATRFLLGAISLLIILTLWAFHVGH